MTGFIYLKSGILATKMRMAEIFRLLLVTALLCYFWLPSGLSQSTTEMNPDSVPDDEGSQGTFSLRDYTSWLRKKHTIRLTNYVVEVGETALIWSPILPVPKGLHWYSLNMENELPSANMRKTGLAYSHYFDKFHKTYNKSWASVFTFNRLNRNLRIQQVMLGYADVYRLHVDSSQTTQMSSDDQEFDVAITLMTYTRLECGYLAMPQSPRMGDTFRMTCSVVINGLWNTSLVFRNTADGSEIRGNVSKCNRQPSVGSRICSTVKFYADADILSYTCNLEFLANQREEPQNPMFQNSKWTTEFNKEDIACYLPKVYLEAIPTDVSILCNDMPCGETVEVNDTITCVAHGYPQPVFNLSVTVDTSAPRILMEESEAQRQMAEHVEDIDKHIESDGMVKRAVKNNVHSFLNSMINISIQLVKIGRGEDEAVEEIEEVDTTVQRNLSEMINILSKQVHAVDRILNINSAIAAPENDEPLPEITIKDLKDALNKSKSAVLKKERNNVNGGLSKIESNKFEKLKLVISTLLSIVETVQRIVAKENDLLNGGKSEGDEEESAQLADEVTELTGQFMDARELNMDEETMTALFDSIVRNYDFPGLIHEGNVFMDGGDDEAISEETSSPVTTEDLTADTQGTLEDAETGDWQSSGQSEPEYYPTSTEDWQRSGQSEPEYYPTSTEDRQRSGQSEPEYYPTSTEDRQRSGQSEPEYYPTSTEDWQRSRQSEPEYYPTSTEDWQRSGQSEPEYYPTLTEDWQRSDRPYSSYWRTWPDYWRRSGGTSSWNPDEDGDGTTESSIVPELKGSEKYQVQEKDVGFIKVLCNVSNEIGYGHNAIHLQVPAPTQKPARSTIYQSIQPPKDQRVSPVTTESESYESVSWMPDVSEWTSDDYPREVTEEIDESYKTPDEYFREVTEESDESYKISDEYSREVTEEIDESYTTPDDYSRDATEEIDESYTTPDDYSRDATEEIDESYTTPDDYSRDVTEEIDESYTTPDDYFREVTEDIDESYTTPDDYSREVTDGSQFSQMPETEMKYSDVTDEYETSTRYSVVGTVRSEEGGRFPPYSSRADGEGKTMPTAPYSAFTRQAEAGAAAGDIAGDDERLDEGAGEAAGNLNIPHADVDPSVDPATTDKSGNTGRRVQSVFLQLFLLCLGACLTWIEL